MLRTTKDVTDSFSAYVKEHHHHIEEGSPEASLLQNYQVGLQIDWELFEGIRIKPEDWPLPAA